MGLDWIEPILRWICGLAGLAVLVFLLVSLIRGSARAPGRTTGRTTFLRSPAFYILVTLPYLALCVLIWRPIGFHLQGVQRLIILAAGTMIFSSGIILVVWVRQKLGRFYFGSTTMGAQLFEDHRLITSGPFAWVRHPMYVGYLFVGLGGVLLFQTWTMVFFAFHFPALILRARREEQVLAAEFGDEWDEYCRRVPAWLPRIAWKSLPPGPAALLELGLLFLPAIPAYIWFWPNVSGNLEEIAQIAVYIYFALGTLWIGRRWTLKQLGLRWQGLWLGLVCAVILIAARTLILFGVPVQSTLPAFTWPNFISQSAYYVGVVGLVEELLFRGLIYRALEDWGGTRLAIWVSSVVFGLWHIFGQGPIAFAGTFFYGLVFALVRWRAGGIIGLIFAHGLMDLATILIVSSDFTVSLEFGRAQFAHPTWVIAGAVLLIFLPIYLWKIHSLLVREKTKLPQSSSER